jgi:transposase
MANFIAYNQEQLMLLPLNIREMIPEDHLVHGVSTLVERLDLFSIYQTYKNSEGGRPSYHPLMLTKVIFYAYAIGVRSSRKIAAGLESDVFFMYLAAMQKPDFRTISDFRKDHLEELKELFQQIVVISMELGIAKIGHISIDGTKMRASAGRRKTKSKESLDKLEQEIEKQIEKMLDEAEEIDEEEDRLYGDTRGDEMPKELRNKEDLIKKIEEAKKKLEEKGLKRVNITDPDSRFMQDADGGIDMSYNTQVAVDDKTQVIVANDVTSQVNDHHQFIPLYEQVVDNTDKKPEEVSADCGYANGKNYMYIEDNKIDAYLPDQMFDKEVDKEGKEKLSRYDRRNFRYNRDKDTFTCPEGKILVFKANQKKDGIKSRIYVGQECSDCRERLECKRASVRYIKVTEVDGIIERMREKLLTEEGKQRYNKRLSTAEPVFGNLKKNLGYRDFQLRGLEKVRGEFQLMCIAHNIKKIHKYATSQKGGGFSGQKRQKTENQSSFLGDVKGLASKKIKTFLFRLIVPTSVSSLGEIVVI